MDDKDFLDVGFSASRASMCDVLRSLIINNMEHFEREKTKSKLADVFSRFLINLNEVEQQTKEVARFAHQYDFDRTVPGNGYRSMVSVVDSCVLHSTRLCRTVCIKRGSFVFRRDHFFKEVEAYCDLMGCLLVVLRLMLKLRNASEPQQLFPTKIDSPIDLLLEAENMDTTCFYGRCLGFQFCDSLKKALKVISIMMASFSDAYYNTGGMISRTASSLVSCGKYICSPELRAERIVEVATKASVDFCKTFWLLQESQLLQQVPGFVCVAVQVNKVVQVPVQSLQLKAKDGTIVDIPVPNSHLPTSPVICRLLSASVREGQLGKEDEKKFSGRVKPRSPYLIIQCHGGGFVAQSSKSHEVYLRDWCTQLDIPFLCIDYSLAPDASYPRPLEECFYAYAWAINNCHQLGSTGEKICFVGDSAGGNLLSGVIVKSIEYGVRLPDGFLSIYTPYLISFIPSPSRLLCLMDPLLPFGFMMRCLKAYAGQPCDGVVDFDADDLCHSESIGFASGESSSGNSISIVTDFAEDNVDPANGYIDDAVFVSNNHSKDDISQKKENLVNEFRRLNVDQVLSSSAMCDDSDRSSFEEVAASDLDTLEVKSEFDTVNKRDVNDSGEGKVEEEENKREKDDYVSEFLDWCVLDAEKNNSPGVLLRTESTESEENVLFEMPVEFPFRLKQRMSRLKERMRSGISGVLYTNKDKVDGEKKKQFNRRKSYNGIFADRSLDDTGSLTTIVEEFKKFTVNHADPYLSTFYASEEILRKFPPTTFLCTALDPCLDDSVMLSKRLRELGCEVNVEILDHLPHGFLNLILVSKDAHDGSDVAVKHLRNLLKINHGDK